jgi:hypothetical protein
MRWWAPRPKPNLEDQSIAFSPGHHLWPVRALPVAMLPPADLSGWTPWPHNAQPYIKVELPSLGKRSNHSLHMSSVCWSLLLYLRVCSFFSAVSLSLVVLFPPVYTQQIFSFCSPSMPPHTYFFNWKVWYNFPSGFWT